MRRSLTILAPLIALTACLARPSWSAAPCTPRGAAVLPVRSQDNAILVPASINGTQVLMQVDTGATTSTITVQTARSLNLPPDPHRQARINGTGGTLQSRNVLIRTFELGGMISSARSMSTAPLARRFPDNLPVAGLIGVSELGFYDIELDTAAGKMVLWYPAAQGCPLGRSGLAGYTVPLSRHHDGMLSATLRVNGQPMRALIDWGATGPAPIMGLEAARRLGVTDAMLAGDPGGVSRGADQRVTRVHAHRFREMRIGAEVFQDPRIIVGPVTLPNVDMLLGMSFAQPRHIWLSFTNREMFVVPARTAGP